MDKVNSQGAHTPELTTPVSFFRANSQAQNLFSVVAGIPATDALSHASCLLDCAISLLEDDTATSAAAEGASRLLEMAKAAIDAVELSHD